MSRPVIVQESDCALETWSSGPPTGVTWRTLISGDRTESSSLTCGIAELTPDSSPRLHRHAEPELYYVLEGEGELTIDGSVSAVRAGTTAFIPGDTDHMLRNTGTQNLRLLYVFAADAFGDIEYDFADER